MKKIIILLALIGLKVISKADNFCAISKQNAVALNPVSSFHAQNLQNKYDTKFHHLNLNLERNSVYVSGNVKTIAKIISTTLDTFAFELHPNFTIDSVLVDGINLPFTRIAGDVFVPVSGYNLNQSINIQTFYRGFAPSGASAAIGNGYSTGTSQSWGNVVSWSLSQPYAAYEWWPCKQQLTDKIDSSWVFITTDSLNKSGSNGVLTNVVNLNNGKKRFEWKSRNPIAYYLISVATARYIEYSYYAHPANSDSVLIQNFIYNNPATLTNFQNDIDDTGDMLELFANLFGPYPFANEKYGHCMAPFSGGMEHQTMTSQGFFNFTLTAHELGHQWFGDNVTCKTWSDIFVNEGMASYCEYLAIEGLQSSAQAKAEMDNVILSVLNVNDGSIYFTDTSSVPRIFDSRLSYDKGAAVLHSLRYVINNDSIFFQSLKNYQIQFANSNATILDFKSVLENTSGINLDIFFNQWIFGQGFPIYSANWNNANGSVYLEISHSTSAPAFTPMFKTPLQIKLFRDIGDTIVKFDLDSNYNYFSFPISGSISNIEIDPNNFLLNKIGSIIKDTTLTNVLSTESRNIFVFPNPLKSSGQLNFTKPILANVFIKDLSGKIVKEYQLNFDRFINLPELRPAVYFLELALPNGKRITERISIVE